MAVESGCPARAVIGPWDNPSMQRMARLQRARGDRPYQQLATTLLDKVAPRERG